MNPTHRIRLSGMTILNPGDRVARCTTLTRQVTGYADGVTHRYRANFYEWAALPDGTRISPYYNYYVRVSCKLTPSGYQYVNDVPDDNQISFGSTITSWNLK